jgi:hypothetical protein
MFELQFLMKRDWVMVIAAFGLSSIFDRVWSILAGQLSGAFAPQGDRGTNPGSGH